MKILFVRPRPSSETIGLQHVMIVEPLELEVLASLIDFKDIPLIFDMTLEKHPIEYFIKREKPNVLCITGYITNVHTMIQYCRIAKKIDPLISTVVGGVHCEVCPEDLDDESVDFRVIRNATTSFPLLLDYIHGNGDLPKGILRPYEQVSLSDLPPFDFSFPLPERSLTNRYRKHYFYIFHNKVALIKTAFGCPFMCNFCFCRRITQGRYSERPLKEVIREISAIQEKEIYIVDDDFFISRTRVLNFIEANKSSNLDKHYLLYGRSNFIVQNPDVIQSFRSIGLKTVIVGLESFFNHELEQYNKNINTKINEEAMKILNIIGIDCYATIIVSPDWGKDEFFFCKEKAKKLGIHYVNFQPLTPLPGTEQTIQGKDLLIPLTDFAKWDLAHVTIRPKKMNVPDFYQSIVNLYKAILFQPRFLYGYLKRYSLLMLLKMAKGCFLVGRQYMRKIREAKRNAQNPFYPTDSIRCRQKTL